MPRAKFELRVLTAAQAEPLALDAELRAYLRYSGSDQDTLITDLITAARQYAENYTRRVFMTQDLELQLEGFFAYPYVRGSTQYPAYCDSVIEIPKPPIQSVNYVKYIDEQGVLQTVDPSLYEVDLTSEPGRIQPVWGQWWPVVRSYSFAAVHIGFTAGYADGSPVNPLMSTGVPTAIKQWMRQRVAQLYEHREAIIVDRSVSMVQVPRDYVDGLLDQFIVRLF